MIETVTRRGLIRGLGAILAAPAIVRVASLMPIPHKRAMDNVIIEWSPVDGANGYNVYRTAVPRMRWRMYNQGIPIRSIAEWLCEPIDLFDDSNFHASPADASPVPGSAIIRPQSRRRLVGEAN